MFAQRVLAWVRVGRRRRMAKVLIIQEMKDKKQDHKWSSLLEIILMIQVAPILWNKQAHMYTQAINQSSKALRNLPMALVSFF